MFIGNTLPYKKGKNHFFPYLCSMLNRFNLHASDRINLHESDYGICISKYLHNKNILDSSINMQM